jgi:hypothetical protein
MCGLKYIGVEKLHTQSSWGDRRDHNKVLLRGNYIFVGHASLQYHGPLKWVWLRLEIKEKYWSILKNKDVICYKLQSAFQTYGHGLRYTANADAAVTDVCTKKPGCCCLNDPLQNQLAICESTFSCT